MGSRFTRILLLGVFVLLAFLALQPYLHLRFYILRHHAL